MSNVKVVIVYSATGNVHTLAEGASKAGGEARLLRVAELAPRAAIEANPTWAAHHPYGVHFNPHHGTAEAADDLLEAARHLGFRATSTAATLLAGRAAQAAS